MKRKNTTIASTDLDWVFYPLVEDSTEKKD